MKKKLNEKQKLLKAEKKLKKDLKKRADALWHLVGIKKWGNVCFFHESGKEAKAHQRITSKCHHIKPKGKYPSLRYDFKDNPLPVCWPCHYKLEKYDSSMIIDVRNKRGKTWWNRLEKKAKIDKGGSYLTISYYNDTIKELEKELNK